MKEVVIVDGVRSAIGQFGKAFKNTPIAEFGGLVLREAIRRSGVDAAQVDEAVYGCVGQIAENAFLARMIALHGGMEYPSTGLTINRLCGSGLQAIATGARLIQSGDAEIVACGGAENMSQYPHYIRGARWGVRLAHHEIQDAVLVALTDPFYGYHMGVTAENVARRFGITREDQDEFAFRSQMNASRAMESGKFDEEIVPIDVVDDKGQKRVVKEDEHVRKNTTIDRLSHLTPAFEEGGTVTAGNSSGINDGTAAVIMMSRSNAEERGLAPKLRFVDYAVSGIDPAIMGYGPVQAIAKVLLRTNLSLKEIGLIELNEAFAAQSLAVIRGADLDIKKVNVNGGAIAHGHPIGATGAILTVKLMNEMIRQNVKYGMVTLCIGGGQGIAAIFENIARS